MTRPPYLGIEARMKQVERAVRRIGEATTSQVMQATGLSERYARSLLRWLARD